MKLFLPVLLSIFCILSLKAQENQQLRGKILNDSLAAPVHIVNINSEKGSLSTIEGAFIIRVKKGDSLLFSSLQFKKEILVVTSKIMQEGSLNIQLEEKVNELEQVSLHDLSGNLEKDTKGMKIHIPTDFGLPMSDTKPPTIVERKISTMNNPMDPVGVLYGVISGEKKQLKKARQNDKLEQTVKTARFLVPESFYLQELNLKEDEILDFLYFCAEKSAFSSMVNQHLVFELMEFYLKRKSDYHKLRDLE